MIGVLALQGDFREHLAAFRRLGVEAREVRLPKDLENLKGLVVPGGESTTIGRLAREYGLEQAVRDRIAAGTLAVWGTCAGAIWLSRDIEGRPNQEHLGALGVTIRRNAYGRQVDSFEAPVVTAAGTVVMGGVFIRAPEFASLDSDVGVVAYHDQTPVWVRQGRLMATTFHPEILGDDTAARAFVDLCQA